VAPFRSSNETPQASYPQAPMSLRPDAGRTSAAHWLARRPASLAEALLWSLIIAAGLRAFSFGVTGLDWDESFYAVVAQRWLHGGVPYADIWDIHPMGVPALYALASWLVGDGLLAARLLAWLAVAGTATLLWAFAERYLRNRLAGLLAALFYLAYMSRPEGLAANTEVFNNLAVAAASFLLAGELVRETGAARPGPVFAGALLLGIGLQLKYVVFPEAVLLCCTLLLYQLRNGTSLRRTLGLAGIAIAAGLLPTAIATLYYWWAGALQPYLDATLRANVAYVDEPLIWSTVLLRLRYGLLPISGLLVWPAVLAVLARRSSLSPRQRMICLWLTVWLIAACIDVVMPLKFWKHYFNALVPPLCLMSALGSWLLARELPAHFGRLLSIGVILTLVPAAVEIAAHISDSRSFDRTNVPREIAERIKAGGSNGHDVYVFDYDPLVYVYSGNTPPSRFVLGVELAEFAPSTGTSAEAEIGRILQGKPRWIVLERPSPYHYTDAISRELDTALRHYELDATLPETDYIQPTVEVALYRLHGEPRE
jgi:4-amino-4-deoxy-L-arabinose transferase-like glycosyltransferase